MTCTACGEKPENTAKDFTKAVIEINNPETLVLFRKVEIPTSLGDDTTVPPEVGKYFNVLLVYEANGHAYLYSSDGIPTLLTTDATAALEEKINEVQAALTAETTARTNADEGLDTRLSSTESTVSTLATTTDNLSSAVETLTTGLSEEVSARTNGQTTLTTAIADETTARTAADTAIDTRLTAVETVASTALQPTSIDKIVVQDLDLGSNPSTMTVQLEASKANLLSGAASTKSIALPVASSTQAGVMNSSTYDAIVANTNNIDAIMNGAVAVSGLSATPTQAEITTAWQTATGLSTLINRASVYDTTNQKVWTYYANTTTWYSASNTSQVTVGPATNSSLGIVMGSTNVGQAFAENDGTLSVNGWDALSAQVSTNTSKLATIAAGAETNVQANWAETDTASDAYILNKPTLATVAITGSYSDLVGAPTVPTRTSQLTNDSNFVNTTALNAKLSVSRLTTDSNITKTVTGSGATTSVNLGLANKGVTGDKISFSSLFPTTGTCTVINMSASGSVSGEVFYHITADGKFGILDGGLTIDGSTAGMKIRIYAPFVLSVPSITTTLLRKAQMFLSYGTQPIMNDLIAGTDPLGTYLELTFNAGWGTGAHKAVFPSTIISLT